MNVLFRALSAEILKTRRTLALAMTVLAPLVIAFFAFAIYYQQREFQIAHADDKVWLGYFQNAFVFWNILMLPLFVTLETALLSALDHNGRHWTLLYTLPVPRWAFYAAKQLLALGLIAISNVVLLVLLLIDAQLLQLAVPAFNFRSPIPWGPLLRTFGLAYLSSWLIITLHLWISMRWQSIVVALGAGIAATVGGVLVFQSEEWVMRYPWTLPGFTAVQLSRPAPEYTQVAVALALGILLALLAMWDVTRQDAL